MMHNTQALYEELHTTLIELDKTINATTEQLHKKIAAMPYPDQTTIYELTHSNGTNIMADLMQSRGQILSAMACLKTSKR